MRSDQFASNPESDIEPGIESAIDPNSAAPSVRLDAGSTENPDLANTERPTVVRFGVLFFLCTMAMLLYLDRVCIGQAKDSIQADLKLDDQQWSWVLLGFILSYSLFEVPTGHWADKHGSRGVITRIVLFWSAFTALTGATVGLWSLVAVRFLFGAGEAGAFPNAALVLTKWFPLHQRGRVRGLIMTVSLLGAAAAPIVSAVLLKSIGWRMMFCVFGAIGVVWSIAFYWWFRDRPADHPGVNDAERLLIDPDGAAGGTAHADRGGSTESSGSARDAKHSDAKHAENHSIPWGIVLTSPNVWLLGTIMMVSAALFYLLFQWYPTYMKKGRGLEEVASGWLSSLVMLGGALGCVLGGLLVDAILKRTEERKWSRRLCGCAVLALSGLAVTGAAVAESANVSAISGALALMFLQMSVPTWWTVVAEISGKHGASMWGLMNSMGGICVFATTGLTGWFVQRRLDAGVSTLEAYNPVFYGISGLLGFGAFLWLFVDPTRSIVERDAPPT